MPGIAELLASLGIDLGGVGAGGPQLGNVGQQAQQRMAQEMQQGFGRQNKRVETREFAGKEFAPSGSLINFTGGSVFPVDETPAIIQNGGILAQELLKRFGGQPQQQQPGGQQMPTGSPTGGVGTPPFNPDPSQQPGSGTGGFRAPPKTNAKSDQAEFGAIGQWIDSMYANQGQQAEAQLSQQIAQQQAQLEQEMAQRSAQLQQQAEQQRAQMQAQMQQQTAQTKLELARAQTGRQRETETAQAQFEAEEAQRAAEAKAQEGAAAAGPFQVQIAPDSPLAQRQINMANPLASAPASFDAMMMGMGQGQGAGTPMQAGAQAASPVGQQQGQQLPQAAQGLPVNTGPTRTTTQSGFRGEVVDEGPFGTNTIPVPSYSQQVSPNELTPDDILAARQNEAVAQAAQIKAQVERERDINKETANNFKDLIQAYKGTKVDPEKLRAVASAMARGDPNAAQLVGELPPVPNSAADTAMLRYVNQRNLEEAREGRKRGATAAGTAAGLESVSSMLQDAKDQFESYASAGGALGPVKTLGGTTATFVEDQQKLVASFDQIKAEKLLSMIKAAGGTRVADTAKEQDLFSAMTPKITDYDDTIRFKFGELEKQMGRIGEAVAAEAAYAESHGGSREGFNAREALARVGALKQNSTGPGGTTSSIGSDRKVVKGVTYEKRDGLWYPVQ